MRSLGSECSPQSARGTTLLELAAVLAILGAVLLIAIPRLSVFEDSSFRSDARRLASLIRQLDDSAAAEKSWYMLNFDIGGNSLEILNSEDGSDYAPTHDAPAFMRLGRTTFISELVNNGGAKKTGQASVIFRPSGAEPFTISLESEGKVCTISYNPFSGKVKII